MSPDLQAFVLEKRDEDRMHQIEGALCALEVWLSNVEDRVYLTATQLQAAESYVRGACTTGHCFQL